VMGDNGNVTITAIVGNEDVPTDILPNSGAAIVSHRPAGAGAALTVPASTTSTGGSEIARRPLPAGWRRPPQE
jgi:hypothetical protein